MDVGTTPRRRGAVEAEAAAGSLGFLHAPVAMALLRDDGTCLAANLAMARAVGDEALSSKAILSLLHPADAPLVETLLSRGGVGRASARVLRADGRWRAVRLTLSRAGEDALLLCLEDSDDLDERARILHALKDVYLRLDADGRVVEWNRAAEQATGLAPDALRGAAFLDLLAEPDRPPVMHAILTAFFGGSGEVEARMPARGGEGARVYHWTGVNLDHATEAAGDGNGIVVFGRDVTDWRRAEETLRQQSVTKDLVRHVMTALGAHQSQFHLRMRDIGRSLARRVGHASLDAHLAAFAGMGLGGLKLDTVEGHRYVFVGSNLLEVTPGASMSTCQLPLGFLEGTVAAMHSDALGSETRCRSLGHEACVFVVQARGNWTAATSAQPSGASVLVTSPEEPERERDQSHASTRPVSGSHHAS